MLIRTTVIALHQANVTGNYTVLRDLGAVEMRALNSDADLAARFASFRQNHVSLAAAVLLDATLDQKPALSTSGQLRLVGHFATKPQQIVFDMTFLYENGFWRIAVLNIGTQAVTTPAPVAAAPATAVKPPPPRPRPQP